MYEHFFSLIFLITWTFLGFELVVDNDEDSNTNEIFIKTETVLDFITSFESSFFFSEHFFFLFLYGVLLLTESKFVQEVLKYYNTEDV